MSNPSTNFELKTSEKDFQTLVWQGHQAGINGVAWAPLSNNSNQNQDHIFASVGNDKKIIFWKLGSQLNISIFSNF